MAVTQQLARLTDEQIRVCGNDLEHLERVCGYVELPKTDHLDLDWAPNLFNRAADSVGLDADLASALRNSTEGLRDVMPGYAGDLTAYSPLTTMSSAEARNVSVALESIDAASLFTPASVEYAAAPWGLSDPGPYVRNALEQLREFYRGAAERGLGVILWWD